MKSSQFVRVVMLTTLFVSTSMTALPAYASGTGEDDQGDTMLGGGWEAIRFVLSIVIGFQCGLHITGDTPKDANINGDTFKDPRS